MANCLSCTLLTQKKGHERKRNRVARNLFGGADFLEKISSYSLWKIGGTENPQGDALAPGSCARGAKEKAGAKTLKHPPRVINNVARSATMLTSGLAGCPRSNEICLAPRLAPKRQDSVLLGCRQPTFISFLFCTWSRRMYP